MARNLSSPTAEWRARRRIEAEIRERALWGQRLGGRARNWPIGWASAARPSAARWPSWSWPGC